MKCLLTTLLIVAVSLGTLMWFDQQKVVKKYETKVRELEGALKQTQQDLAETKAALEADEKVLPDDEKWVRKTQAFITANLNLHQTKEQARASQVQHWLSLNLTA